jgi:uncharacterized repeat protein (TIGR03803 family)
MARSNSWKVVGIVSAFVLAATLAASAQVFSSMTNFNSNNGRSPMAPLIQASDGYFYGTTQRGGVWNQGVVFKIAPWDHNVTVLHSFTGAAPEGGQPLAGLVQGNDGNFYGTTSLCLTGCFGTVFKITPDGNLTTLHGFSFGDGASPQATLIQGVDGALYGTTWSGGSNNCGPQHCGTIFRVTTDGSTFTALFSFSAHNGSHPQAAMLQGSDGTLYGTTWSGGVGNGVVYKINPDGTAYSVVYSFDGINGAHPAAPLVWGPDGKLYGTTANGGAYRQGVVFAITPGLSFTKLYDCDIFDGANPNGALLVGIDGNLYGTTSNGGAHGAGSIFRIAPSGNSFVDLYDFTGIDGAAPKGALIQAVNGSFYGTASAGGTLNMGTVFSISPMAQKFVPVTSCRLLDTRTSNPIPAQTTVTLDLKQLAQINACDSPTNAQSYALNLTIVPRNGPVGFVTLWPAGSNMPVASTTNAYNGEIKANAAIVPAGVDGNISVYASNTTDIILDYSGFFTEQDSSGTGLDFYSMTPCRVLDTRTSNGPLGGPNLTGNVPRQFPMMASACFAGLTPPIAYSLNVTVVPHQPNQPMYFMTLWPSDQNRPNVSTLNNPLATAVANAAIVPAGAGADGAIEAYASNDTDLIIDVNGYFASPATGGLQFYPAMPCRSLDTRKTSGAFSGATTADTMQTVCTPPISPGAFVYNATVVPNGPLGYLTLWPDSIEKPWVSTLNAYTGSVTSNMAIVPNLNGAVDAFAAGSTNLVLDLNGYFAPATGSGGD